MPRKTAAMRLAERDLGRPLEEALYDMYVVQGLSAHEIARQLGVTKASVLNWLRRLGIPTRTLMLPPEAETASRR